jgi:DNA processing protein
MALAHWLQLTLTEGIGPILSRRLIDVAGSVEAACAANATLLRSVEGIGPAKAEQIRAALARACDEAPAEIDRAGKLGASLVCLDEPDYPLLLKAIPDPPGVLYVRGKLEPRDLHALAIVGSRRCSHYGREQAERISALIAGAAMTVISGGARGVDSAAHRGAISHPQGRTIAVLGCGVDVAYPPENDGLFRLIEQRGAVVSEFPLGTPPIAENFPRRNRIVSGMSRGVLVIEADVRSGALITARQACDDHGRPVFAVPGRVDNKMSAGPHKLIRDGAVLTETIEDILDNLGPLPEGAAEPTRFPTPSTTEDLPDKQADLPGLTDDQSVILSQLDDEALSADAIIERTSLPAAIVMRELTMLALRGAVKRVDGQAFTRAR